MKQEGAQHPEEKSADQHGNQGHPDAQLPASQQQNSNRNFHERQGVRHETRSGHGKYFVGVHLHLKKSKRDSQGRARAAAHGDLGITRINESYRQHDAANPDEQAAIIERGGLQHGVLSYPWALLLRQQLIEKILQHLIGDVSRVRIRLALGMKYGGGSLIHGHPQSNLLILVDQWFQSLSVYQGLHAFHIAGRNRSRYRSLHITVRFPHFLILE